MVTLFEHQRRGLTETEAFNRVAYYWDMGTGKTFVGSEKLMELNGRVNLVVCQKSKIDDWIEHFNAYYPECITYNGTKTECLKRFIEYPYSEKQICVINYELLFRRPELKTVKYDTLMLDESSLIQNDTAKRTKFILSLETESVMLV